MRQGLLASAILGLGFAMVVPATARADDWRRYRDDDRGDWRRVERRDCVEDVAMCDVPGRVRDRVNDYRHGRRIEGAQLVREDGASAFYRFRIDDRRHGDFYLDIAPDGHVLGRINGP